MYGLDCIFTINMVCSSSVNCLTCFLASIPIYVDVSLLFTINLECCLMYRLVCFFGLYPWIDALKLLLISIIHEHIWASKENIPWWNVSKSWWMNWYFSCITGEAKKKSSFISSAASRPIPRLMPPLLTLPHPYYSLIFNLLEKLDQCLGLVCYGWFRHVSNKAAATIRYSPELGRVSNLLHEKK